ncbi:hypothetical protein ACFLVS_04745 [Chloroflexota bacterium]
MTYMCGRVPEHHKKMIKVAPYVLNVEIIGPEVNGDEAGIPCP